MRTTAPALAPEAPGDRPAAAESTYREAIALARESGQRVDLVFSLSGLAWLQARRGREADCRALAAEALELSGALGTGLQEVWALAALGELELGLGNAAAAVEQMERQRRRLRELEITPENESWAVRAGTALEAGAGVNTIGSCSAIGPGGQTGCFNQRVRESRREDAARAAERSREPQ